MNHKKLWGAIISGGVFILYFGLLFGLFFFSGILTGDIPFPLFVLLVIFLMIPLFGISYALFSRIQEIKNGEEEEAKKY